MIRTFVNAGLRRGGALRTYLFGGLLALALLPSLAGAQSIEDKYRANRDRLSKFNLASAPTMVLDINQFQCGLTSAGDTCTDVFDSPTGGGGFWPTGSPNQYMFNSGLQVVGVIPRAANCTSKATSNTPTCFPWSGDTTGAFFMDAAGTNQHGTPITDIYNSLDANDLANWPAAGSIPDFPTLNAFVDDTSLFNDVLIGRAAASQQDSWVAYWDGDPNKTGGRQHPMGIVVEQRTMAWNYPEGNENVIYFIYRFTNVTNNPAFQRVNEARYFGGANLLPDAGWKFDSVFVAFDSDPDVGPATNNYATGILPFNMGITYEGPFYDDAFDYDPSIFHAPFFPRAPGIVGMKYLKSPIDPATGQEVGLTSLSLHTNGGRFPDPSTVQRGWRYISLNVDAGKGDPACSFDLSEVKERRTCFLNQSQSDVRIFIGSGPFSLGPGETSTIAVAMFAAATVQTPLITSSPTADNKPGIPSTAPGCFGNPILPIEVASGWVRTNACPAEPTDVVNQFDVTVVPGSLLGRALVAQSIFDNKFLLGFAPEAPTFYLVPGDDRVTVVWEPSATEQNGDPFFAAAGDQDNALYDPNYRRFDVEGYRIYRGTSPSNMQLIAQFDKKGSTFTDVLCTVVGEEVEHHDVIGLHVTGEPCTDTHTFNIGENFVQTRSVTRLANNDPFLISADTVVGLEDSGIPFAFIDNDVRNGFQYFYRVTAFDVNSLRSGPSSLESAAPAKPVTPRAASTSLTEAVFSVGRFGRGTTPLGSGPNPTINSTTGTFSGPAQPSTMLTGDFRAFAGQLLQAGVKEVRVDSIVPNYYPNGDYGTIWLTVDGVKTSYAMNSNPINGDGSPYSIDLPVVTFPSDPTVRSQLEAAGVEAPPLAGSIVSSITFDRPHFSSTQTDWTYKQPGFWGLDPATGNWAGGSRWFTGANETKANPTIGMDQHGELPNMVIFKPLPYKSTVSPTGETRSAGTAMTTFQGIDHTLFRRWYQTMFGLNRAADVKLYWGTAGLDSVIDVTHNVPVSFSTAARASFGFLNDGNGDGILQWGDFMYIPGFEKTANIGGFSTNTPKPLSRQPVVLPVDSDGNLTADGNGFALFINGEPWIFRGAVPTSTVWTLRTYYGNVALSSAGAYSFSATPNNPTVPGLRFAAIVESPALIVAAETDLTRIHTVPDPYYAVSQFDLGPSTKELQFVNMPAEATIRIYSLSGVLVDVVNHNDPAGGGVAKWNLRNRSNQFVASGVYFYHVTTPEGKEHVGKFTVINAGFSR